jgi:hypothetical protein
MFTDDCEYGQEIRQAKEFPDALANVEKLQLAARSLGRSIESDEGAEAHAVHASDIRQVQHDSFGGWDHWTDPGVEAVGHLRDYLSVAPHDRHVVGTLDRNG